MIDAADAAARRRRGVALTRDGDRPELRVQVLGSFNLDLLPPYLLESLDRVGLDGRVGVRPFAESAGEVLDPASQLYAARPDAIVLVASAEDPLGDEAELGMLVRALRTHAPGATVVLVPMGPDRLPAEHVLSPAASPRGRLAGERFLAQARALAAPSVLVCDWEWRARRAGTDALHDRRLWYLARMRLGPVGLAHLAEAIAQELAASRGSARKVCALDLDDLVWGGEVGEVGLAGLALGEEGVGSAFQDMQRVLGSLRETGVLLAACSKNDPANVWEVFERHPGMVLRRDDLSAERVNWRDKATNLEEIAAELDLGLDSFVFLDDDPVERGWVRAALPEVAVPDLPADPVDRPDRVRRLALFQRIEVTQADAARPGAYRAEARRRDARRGAPSLDEYLAGLRQRARIEPVDGASVGRAAQLTQRTNQFNLVGRDYTVAGLEELMADPAVEAHLLALSDRFGDSGFTGLAILRLSDGDARIESLLLSCRVLGRHVEDALLAFLAERARARGARRLVGLHVPTGRNHRVEDFYASRGFAPDGEGRFAIAPDADTLDFPPGIEVLVAERPHAA